MMKTAELFELTPSTANPKAELFDAWVTLCQQVGIKESGARSFLGKVLKEYPVTAVYGAVGVACGLCPAEPISYVTKLLQDNPKTGKRAEWSMIPFNNDDLVEWGVKHGYLKNANTGTLTYDQLRAQFRSQVTKRLDGK